MPEAARLADMATFSSSVLRLDGTSWTPTQQITTNDSIHADVKVVDDLAHVLLFDGTSSQIATLQYDAADNRFEPWALQPQPVNVPISSSAETATLEVDSTGGGVCAAWLV